MEQVFCQSCGMPIMIPEDFGKNQSGDRNSDYCRFCYRDGDFTAYLSMDEMIGLCVRFTDEWNTINGGKISREEAIRLMEKDFPRLKRWVKKKNTTNEYHKAVNRAVDYINRHINDSIDLEKLAGIAHISEFHFHRIFRSIIGENVGTYIQRIRLENAAMCLRSSTQSIIGIAEKTGYQSIHSFSKAFRKHFGISPSAYRNGMAINNRDNVKKDYDIHFLHPRLIERDEAKYAYIRIIDAYGAPKAYKLAWGKLYSFASENDLIDDSSEFLGISFDDPTITTPERCRFYACITTRKEIKPEGEFGVHAVDKGLYAVFSLKGPYEGLKDVYQAIYLKWLPASPYRLRGTASFEKYLNNRGQVKEEELLTEIYIPVERDNTITNTCR